MQLFTLWFRLIKTLDLRVFAYTLPVTSVISHEIQHYSNQISAVIGYNALFSFFGDRFPLFFFFWFIFVMSKN